MAMREELIAYVRESYRLEAENPFSGDPDSIVFRQADNRKWFGLVMYVRKSSLGLSGDSYVDILNVKADPYLIDTLISLPGFLRGYHMNKEKWLTVLLDGTVSMEQVKTLLDESFCLTASRKNRKKDSRLGPKAWLVPANPKYYDVIAAFEAEEVINWKQSSDVQVGDLVYLYVAAPYSSILYKCKALEVNIPHNFESKELTVKKVMRIQRLESYPSGQFSFEWMKRFGVYAVRGPRSMPEELIKEIDWQAGKQKKEGQ